MAAVADYESDEEWMPSNGTSTNHNLSSRESAMIRQAIWLPVSLSQGLEQEILFKGALPEGLSLDAPLPTAREEQPSETYDLDREDEDGNPIPVPKRTPEEEAVLKAQLDKELDAISRGECEFDPTTPEGKEKLAMGWKPIGWKFDDGEWVKASPPTLPLDVVETFTRCLDEVKDEDPIPQTHELTKRLPPNLQTREPPKALVDRVQRTTALVKRLSDETQVRSVTPEFPNLQSVILSLLDRNIGIGYACISAGLDEVYSDSPDQDTLQEILHQLEHTDGYIYSEEDLDEDCEDEGCSYILTSDGKERLHKQITAIFVSRVDLGPFNNLGEKCIKSINAHLEHTASTSLKDSPKQTYRVYRQLFKMHRRSTMW